MSAATRDNVDVVIKEAARMLQDIPVTDLVISDEERYIPEDKKFYQFCGIRVP